MLLLPLIPLLTACDSREPIDDPEEDLLDFLSDLDGVQSTEGVVLQLDAEACDAIVADGTSCPGGVNLSSPYGMWTFPDDAAPSDGNYTFQLGLDEALIYVGRTPPQARYFSYTLYQYSRVLPNGEEFLGRGSVAPSLNHRVIRLSAEADTPFDQFVVVVVTANPHVAERTLALIEPVLAGHGIEAAVNLMGIPWRNRRATRDLRQSVDDPGSIVDFRPGHGDEFDRYMVAWRTADPSDPTDPFFDPEQPQGSVLRLRFEDTLSNGFFDYPVLPPPDASPHTEGVALTEARDALVEAVRARFATGHLQSVIVTTTNGERKSGFECNNGLTSCFLNSDDARYMRNHRSFRLKTDASSFFLVGVVHDDVQLLEEQAADVGYSNLSLVDRDALAGTLLSRMDHELRGSARVLFPEGVEGVSDAELDALYVLRVARRCGPQEPLCVEIPYSVAPEHVRIGWTERVYLNESTFTAPPPSAVLPAVAVGVGPSIIEEPFAVDLD